MLPSWFGASPFRHLVPNTVDKRRDQFWIPGASQLFPHVLGYQTDLRFDYKYISDHPNDPTKSFTDNVFTFTLVHRFDPTQYFWKQLASATQPAGPVRVRPDDGRALLAGSPHGNQPPVIGGKNAISEALPIRACALTCALSSAARMTFGLSKA
jgi:hypothetical protein